MTDIEKLGGVKEAFRYAEESVSDFLEIIPLEKLKTLKTEHFVIDVHPDIAPIGRDPETQGYKLTDALAGALAGKAHKHAFVHNLAVEVCAANIFNGYALPLPLRAFAALKLRSQGPTPPRKRGPAPGGDFVAKMLMRKLAMDLVELFDIKLTRNKAGPPNSACDAVVAAAGKHGWHITYDAVHGWHLNKDHEGFRQQADEIVNLMKESALIHWGALRPRVGD